MTAAQARTRGREFFDQRAWGDAFAELSAADREVPLEPEDVGRLATAAYLLGRDEDSVELWERAHQEQLSAGDVAAAARYAGWLVFVLLNGGEFARAGGWLARARRLLDDGEHDGCAEQGHLLVPLALQRAVAGDWESAYTISRQAAEIGERFDDVDLVALARNVQARALIAQGRTVEGMTLLDEVMVAVTADEVSEMVAGSLYCSVIEACQEVFDLRSDRDDRARGLPRVRPPQQDPRRPIIRAPGMNGVLVASMRGGDFLFESGQDLSIGYDSHDSETVQLYLEESFSFRVATAEAAIALVRAPRA